MKSRNREINIFNMSLLDILCGALGAFCFMMLSLLPYYHPPGEDYKKVSEEQQKMLEEIKDIKDLAERLKFTSNAEDQRELVEKLLKEINLLENRIKELQGQVNGLIAEKEELKKQIEALKDEKQKLLARNEQLENENENLKQRNAELKEKNDKLEQDNKSLQDKVEAQVPWMLTLNTSDTGQYISTYLREMKVSNSGKVFQAAFDPNNKFQPKFWPGDYILRLGSQCVWVTQDRWPGCEIKVYGQLTNDPQRLKDTTVSGSITGDQLTPVTIPALALTPERFWALVGTVRIGNDRVPRFTVATQQERDAEWEELTKTKPPAEPPPPAPTANDPNGIARARENMRRTTGGLSNRMLDGLSPAATQRVQVFASSIATATDEGQRRALFQKADAACEDAAERDVIRAIMVRVTALQPRPGNAASGPRAPGAGPAVPFGVNPGPPPPPPPPPAPAPSQSPTPAPK